MLGAIVCIVLFDKYLTPQLEVRGDNSLHVIGWSFLAFFFALVLFTVNKGRYEQKELNAFIKEYSFKPLKVGEVGRVALSSRYVSVGKSSSYRMVMSRAYLKHTITFYDCRVVIAHMYSKGFQKIPVELMYTTCEVTIPSNLPDIFLKSKKQNYPDFAWKVDFSGMEEVSLSETLERNFTTYITIGSKSKVQSYLSPVVIEKLITYGQNFHIEINNDRFFIHCSGYEHSPKKLKAMNGLAECIISSLRDGFLIKS